MIKTKGLEDLNIYEFQNFENMISRAVGRYEIVVGSTLKPSLKSGGVTPDKYRKKEKV